MPELTQQDLKLESSSGDLDKIHTLPTEDLTVQHRSFRKLYPLAGESLAPVWVGKMAGKEG